MANESKQNAYVKAKPILIGLFTVAATVTIGMGTAVALGFVSPTEVFAQVAPCCTPPVTPPTPPPPPPVTPPIVLPPAPAPAPSCSIVASPASITAGDSATLTWVTRNAVSFSMGGTSGSKTVSPSTTTTYTGTATNADGVTAHCSVTITVTPAPAAPTCTIVASPASIMAGDSSTLTWTTKNATSFSMGGTSGSKTVSPSTTTTYTGTVTGAGGTAHCSVTVTVTPAPLAPTCSLVASPASITSGDSATISWVTKHANTFSITNGIGSVTPVASGSTTVSPTTTTTYTGTVVGDGGTAHCSVTITVTTTPNAPSCTLTANPTAIATGDSSTLTWTSKNATTASLDHGIGPVALNDSTSVSPTANTTYTLTVTDAGGTTAHCSATIIVTNNPEPSCTLAANPTTITKGGSSELSWTTTNADTFSINQSIGDVTPVPSGSTTVSPKNTVTYTGTATGLGGTAHCSATITVSNLPPPEPTCTLSANPTTITSGSSSTLSWTTTNGTSFSIDHGIGSVTPVSAGTQAVSPTATTTYTGTVVGDGGTAHCTATVTVTTAPPDTPTCTLSANPTSVNSGDHTILSWTTTNADTFSIDQGIGSVMPASTGTTTSKAITSNTTFTGTAVSPTGKVATCAVTVTTGGGGGGGPACSLTVSPSSYQSGGSATLSWSGTDIGTVDIDNGIATGTSTPGSVTVSPTAVQSYTYTGTFHATNGQTLTCSATLQVTGGGGGGCSSNCGGGGGSPPPTITLAALPHATSQPLAYLYLSQIPYTGLDLGPLGTALYWVALIGWSLALAYLVLFGALPFATRSVKSFTARVSEVLNTEAQVFEERIVAPVVAAVSSPAPAPVYVQESSVDEDVVEVPRGYSTYDGFRSFASGDALSIEDIVKGLARHSAPAPKVAPAPRQAPESVMITESMPKRTPAAPAVPETVAEVAAVAPVAAGASVAPHIRGFIASLVERDREAVFGALRQHVRGGGDAEHFITNATCALDDAYRARVDGTECDPEVARICATCDTPTLERLVGSLTTAIDSSYSAGVTGAKLALTRALGALGA